MAIDDVISDFEAQISNGSALSITPGSGDEWLVTHLLVEGDGWSVRPHTDAGVNLAGLYGAKTSANTNLSEAGLRSVKFVLTESEYIRLHNATGGTVNAGYSAIKTKD